MTRKLLAIAAAMTLAVVAIGYVSDWNFFLASGEVTASEELTLEERKARMRTRVRDRLKASRIAALEEEGDRGGTGFAAWFYDQRTYPGTRIPPGAYRRAMEHAAAFNLARGASRDRTDLSTAGLPRSIDPMADHRWFFLGPSTLPAGQTDTGAGGPASPVSGRVQDIAVHPSNPNIVYAGGAQGGVWKTENALAAQPIWTPLTDDEASLAIGSIAIDPVDPDIVYVGTGERAVFACDAYYGRGVLRSADGGATWTLLGGGPAGPFDLQSVTKLIIDPSSAGTTSATTVFASIAPGLTTSGTSACNLAPNALTGGLFRSTDSGANWTLLNLPTGAGGTQIVHDLALDPTDPNTLYASVRGFGNQAVAGVWKSTNALDATPAFSKVATGFVDHASGADPQTRRIALSVCGSVVPGTLYAAIESLSGSALWGLYRTDNGGTSWRHVDGGDNGTCDVSGTAVTATGGFMFASSMLGQRIVINNRFSRLVSSVDSAVTLTLSGDLGTNLAGATCSIGRYPRFCDGQCFYDIALGCDPGDATGDTVYVGGNPRSFANDLSGLGGSRSAWFSDDGGATWTGVSQGDGVGDNLHTDLHVYAFDPSVTPTRVYSGNDGGIWRSDDEGASWVTMNTNIGITQFQSLGLHPSDVDVMIGGTQDNGTNIRAGSLQTPPVWFHTDFGDGGQAFIDQADPTRVFHTYFNQAFNFQGPAKSTNSGLDGEGNWPFVGGYFGYGAFYYNGFIPGDPVSFYAPLTNHPATNPNLVYFGTDKVFRSADPLPPFGVTSWAPVSPSLPVSGGSVVSWIEAYPQLVMGNEILYAGSSDGTISVAQDVSAATSGCPGACTSTWTTISDATTPGRFVTDIEVSQTDANTVYVTFSGFGVNTPGTPGHVYRSTDGLAVNPTWVDISGNLPDIPANAVAVDETTMPATLYVGTDTGVFRSTDSGTSWTLLDNGHPNVAVFGLDRNPSSGQIVSSTHGRGMWELGGTGSFIFTDGFESGDVSLWN